MSVIGFSAPEAPVHTRCWVRVQRLRDDGFVEFDFALGDPGLSVDLILPQAAFNAFCATHQVRPFTLTQGQALDDEQARWRHGRCADA